MSVHPDHGAGYPPAYAQPQYQPMMNQPMPPTMMNQQQTTTNIVMINQPQVQGQKLILGPVSGHRNWTTDLFSCCEDIGSCKIYGKKLFVCLFLINTLPYNPYFGTPLEKKAFYFRTPLEQKTLENIVGKGENASNQHFLLFPQCFLPFATHISQTLINPLPYNPYFGTPL